MLQEAKGDSFFAEEMNFVKIYDLVCDVALCIAKKKKNLIMGPERSQKALQENMMDDKVRYLWLDHNVNKFPNQLDCSELEFLHISNWKCVRDDFFPRNEEA